MRALTTNRIGNIVQGSRQRGGNDFIMTMEGKLEYLFGEKYRLIVREAGKHCVDNTGLLGPFTDFPS